jgi:Tfp pilus assembly protein PilF
LKQRRKDRGRNAPRGTRALILAAIGVAFVTILTFAPVRHFDFVNYDDLEFVAENPHVATGLTAANVRWAFTHPYTATGGPITWISHMLDVELFGLDPGAHHVTSLAIHLCNALLLLLVLWDMTGAVGRSAWVAALFAVHPLHVESVAWVAQRKDVLSTFFWLLTMWAYVAYARRPFDSPLIPASKDERLAQGRPLRRYVTVALLLTLGLMSKPMVATLPFVLLLLDVWPLQRLPLDRTWWGAARRLTLEKLPLFALAAASIALTFAAQREIGAVAGFDAVPLPLRLANAAVSYVAYIGRMFWPAGLAAFYPYRESVPPLVVAGCVLALAAATAAAIRARPRAPYATVGWLWYLGTLVPVVGIVQVGGHAMADRFTYVPLVGLFIVLAWGGAAVRARAGLSRASMTIAAMAAVLACAILARGQALHWQNGVALWEHATRVTRDNARAHANLGVSLARQGQLGPAIAEYREALRLEPGAADTHNNLALALVGARQPDAARAHYEEAIRVKPAYANAHTNLANLLDEQGRADEAIRHYREAIRLEPDHLLAHVNLAMTLARMGRAREAIPHLETALRINPGYEPARRVLDEIRKDR